jgi:aldehyde dehydrogenase (NAD+)/succinate-semialdehyde dehydrogenase/glutarate-semialdehyde dehydrogenase
VTRPDFVTDDLLARLVSRVPSTSGGTWKLTEVYTGEVVVELPQSTPADIESAYAAARRAQAEWSQWSLRSRLRVFRTFHSLVVARQPPEGENRLT